MIASLFRKLPHFKGKKRIARLLFSKTIENGSDLRVNGKFSCSYLVPNIKEIIGFEIFVNGVYELDTINTICRLLPPNGTFLDLGSNIGSVLIPVALKRPDVFSIAVEAAPWIIRYLETNIELNKLHNIKLVNKAVFDQDNLELDFFSPNDKYGKGSLSPVFTKDAVKVKTKKVDTLVSDFGLKKVDLIKIDVEGFEYFVFKGAEKLLSGADAPVIVFEFEHWAEEECGGLSAGDAQRLLLEYGYELFESHNGVLSPLKAAKIKGEGNLLAIKPGSNKL